MKRAAGKNRYCITVASQSDANRRTRSFTASRGALAAGIVGAALAFTLAVSGALWTAARASTALEENAALAALAAGQASALDACTARVAVLQKAEQYRMVEAQQAEGLAPVRAQEGAREAFSTGAELTEPAIAVRDAAERINAAFMEGIEAQLEVAKLGAPADSTEIVYSGDVEGDSDTVNNWADVLAAFAVQAGYEIDELGMITQQDFALLGRIHDDMNRVAISSRVSTAPEASAGRDGEASGTKLTLCVTVASMDCMEYARQLDWGRDTRRQLDKLMSPDYYMTFAALLGVDLYSGLNSEELAEIIGRLEPGRVGTIIVEAALMRVGDPYSRSRRGSGDYVDCSYFAYWACKQAGIIIPTSSVEQAKYFYNHGYTIKRAELQPGDLLYWAKTTCDCGRWREIHHAGIYIGDGMIVEASSSKGRVVIRPIWGGSEWRLALCARPGREAEAAAPSADTTE